MTWKKEISDIITKAGTNPNTAEVPENWFAVFTQANNSVHTVDTNVSGTRRLTQVEKTTAFNKTFEVDPTAGEKGPKLLCFNFTEKQLF